MKNKSLALIIGTLISVVSFGQNNIDALDSIKKKYDLFPDSTAHFNKIAMEIAKITRCRIRFFMDKCENLLPQYIAIHFYKYICFTWHQCRFR